MLTSSTYIVQISCFALVGLLAGFLGGLSGIGGGIVIVPCLITLLKYFGFPAKSLIQVATGTSLAAMIFNTFSAAYSHYRKEGILFSIIRPMSLGILGGALLGSVSGRMLPSFVLELIFGLFECLLGLRLLLAKEKSHKQIQLPSSWALSIIALGISAFSILLGIGGGPINLSLLMHYRVPLRQAIGTSSALSFFIAVTGAFFSLLIGMKRSSYPSTYGFIYVPAFAAISLTCLFAAPWGVKAAYKLNPNLLRQCLGIFLFLGGIIVIKS